MVQRASMPAGGVSIFRRRLFTRMAEIAKSERVLEFRMPVALVLLLDEGNGGNGVASEVAKRFQLLDRESATFIDFYFAGWQPVPRSQAIRFDLSDFMSIRDALAAIGITQFGGNADLILFDAVHTVDRILLDFSRAISIDLTNPDLPPAGRTLEAIIDAARELSHDGNLPVVPRISDRLGLLFARQSFLNAILDRLGALIGAKTLQTFTTRRLAPVTNLNTL